MRLGWRRWSCRCRPILGERPSSCKRSGADLCHGLMMTLVRTPGCVPPHNQTPWSVADGQSAAQPRSVSMALRVVAADTSRSSGVRMPATTWPARPRTAWRLRAERLPLSTRKTWSGRRRTGSRRRPRTGRLVIPSRRWRVSGGSSASHFLVVGHRDHRLASTTSADHGGPTPSCSHWRLLVEPQRQLPPHPESHPSADVGRRPGPERRRINGGSSRP